MKLVDAQLIQSDPRLLSGVNATNKQNRDNKGHGVNSSPKLIPLFLFFLLYVICLLGAASGLGGGWTEPGVAGTDSGPTIRLRTRSVRNAQEPSCFKPGRKPKPGIK